MTDVWYNTVDSLNKKIFDGSDESIKILGDMMADGKLLERGNTVSDPDIQKYLEGAIFGYLIPRAWSLGKTYPFVLDSGAPCGAINPVDQHLPDDVAATTWTCVDDKLYYLLAPYGDSFYCNPSGDGQGVGPCYDGDYSAPEGLDKLDGKAWGGVTKDDFIAG